MVVIGWVAERRALIDDLATLTPQQWETPSLAQGWSVHDVAAHLIDNALTTPGRLLRGMAAARFDFDRQNAAGVAANRGASPAETLTRLRAVADRTSGPPTFLAAEGSRLVEEIAHGEDIRRRLNLHRAYPPQSLAEALGYQARTREAMGGAKGLVGRVTLVATDAPVRLGRGPEVRGTALALLMLATGRRHGSSELSGPGVSLLPTDPA
ncbi:MAG: maleylpyruvate isomerase family mycothiol-dependent enzyme [Actinobacteria bacterium]|nr:maleylpyruvate isomerase family mycothiol-dependent enzyme [Actinomycetota bacterium]